MERRQFLRTTVGVTAGGALAGCSAADRTQDASGTLVVQVSLQDERGDLDKLSALSVTFDGVRVREGGEQLTHDIEPTTVDFTSLGGGSKQVTQIELESKTYELLQLVVSESNAILKDGNTASIETEPGDPVTYDKAFDVFDGMQTTFVADTVPTADDRGDSPNTFQLLPDPDEVTVTYGTS
jgi:hypothetical protein